jgi:hypothetical protein
MSIHKVPGTKFRSSGDSIPNPCPSFSVPAFAVAKHGKPILLFSPKRLHLPTFAVGKQIKGTVPFIP